MSFIVSLNFFLAVAQGEQAHGLSQQIQLQEAPPNAKLADSCSRIVKVNFMGDIFLSAAKPFASKELFSGVQHLLQDADFNVANFEGVITTEKKPAFPNFPYALLMRSDAAKVLAKQGIFHVTRSNNHSMDYGEKGMLDTSQALKAEGISFTGAGRNVVDALNPLIIEKNGVKIAVVAFTTTYPEQAWATSTKPGVAFPTAGRLNSTISELKSVYDYVVVSFHWGEESSPELKGHQVSLADIALAAGADAIVGHHAHVAQAIEQKKNRWVVYGLGNFVFNSHSANASMGLLARFSFCASAGKSAPRPNPQLEIFPIDTLTLRNGLVTKHMTKEEFLKNSKEYFDKKLFSRNMPWRFYANHEN